MYTPKRTTSFKRDYKRVLKRGKNPALLEAVILTLAAGFQLEPKYRDHALKGEYAGARECHIEPDWLLIYRLDKGELELLLLHTDTHSGLF